MVYKVKILLKRGDIKWLIIEFQWLYVLQMLFIVYQDANQYQELQ